MLNDFAKLARECAYCGSTSDLTKEHVIPRSFEAEGAPTWHPIIVWACRECNGQKSPLDSKVRDLFAVDIIGGGHGTAQKLMAGKIKRSVIRSVEIGHKHHLLELAKSMKPDQIVGSGGRVIASGMGTHLTDDPFTPWFRYVVMGISAALTEHRMIDPFELKLGRYYPDGFEVLRQELAASGVPDPVRLGTHTRFTHRPVDGASPGHGVWVFEFYGGVVLVVFVAPEGTDWQEGQ
jgi:hypothetical protein